MSKMPFSALLNSRSKSDHAKQLRDLFTVIENEQDKEKKHHDDVSARRATLLEANVDLFAGDQEYSQDADGVERRPIRPT